MNKILQGDCINVLRSLESESADCCVTSPPYFGLRDYGMSEQIGLEETPEAFVGKMVEVFTEVKRVLKKEGTLWLNLGDSYAGSGKGRNADGSHQEGGKQGTSRGTIDGQLIKTIAPDCKPKDLIGIPWMVAFALRSSGWYLRQDLIWHKPNPMPESVTDRCTKAHEYIFLLSKSAKYYYDHESAKEPTVTRDKSNRDRDNTKLNNVPGRTKMAGLRTNDYEMRNKRSVWTVTTKPFKGAHFATFPPDLIEPCILAGCPVGGVVLDPFFGAGTTGLVAQKHGRNYIGIELNPSYIEIAETRLGTNTAA